MPVNAGKHHFWEYYPYWWQIPPVNAIGEPWKYGVRSVEAINIRALLYWIYSLV